MERARAKVKEREKEAEAKRQQECGAWKRRTSSSRVTMKGLGHRAQPRETDDGREHGMETTVDGTMVQVVVTMGWAALIMHGLSREHAGCARWHRAITDKVNVRR